MFVFFTVYFSCRGKYSPLTTVGSHHTMSPSLRAQPLRSVLWTSALLPTRRFLTTPLTRTSRHARLTPLSRLITQIHDTHTSRIAFRRFLATQSPPASTRPEDPSLPPPPQPDIFGGFFLSPLILQLLSGSFFIFLGYGLALTLTPFPLDTSLKPSVLAKAEQAVRQPKYGPKEDYHKAIEELKALWAKKGKEDRVSVDQADLESHGISDWSYHEEKRPTVVVWVDSTVDVQEIVIIAQKYRVPITPFSGGTSLEGHFSSVSTPYCSLRSMLRCDQPFGGISLDMSMMDKILRVSEADGDMTVQPGVKWEDVNSYLADEKIPLFFPLDPGPGATIGGMVGTGCSGTNAVRYGTAKAEWFLNLVNSPFPNETSRNGFLLRRD